MNSSSSSSLWVTAWEKFKVTMTTLGHYPHVHEYVHTAQRVSWSVLLYKPPVGLWTVYTIVQWVVSGRILGKKKRRRLQDQDESESASTSAGQVLHEEHSKLRNQNDKHSRKHNNNKGRALTLEEGDQSYHTYGMVERVRGRLCVAALSDIILQKQQQEQLQVFETAIKALQISCPPGGSLRLDYLDKLKEPLAQLRAAEGVLSPKIRDKRLLLKTTTYRSRLPHSPQEHILNIAIMTVEVRATDAILRMARDKLLQTTYQWARTVQYWNRRIEKTAHGANALSKMILPNDDNTTTMMMLEEDRINLSLAEAAYDAELNRLGRVCDMLMLVDNANTNNSDDNISSKTNNGKHEQQQQQKQQLPSRAGRPKEMNHSHLLRALKKGRDGNGVGVGDSSFSETKKRHVWNVLPLGSFSLEFHGFRPVVLRHHFTEGDTYIDGSTAMDMLLLKDQRDNVKEYGSTEEWYANAQIWIQKARTLLCNVIEESLQDVQASLSFVVSSEEEECQRQVDDIDFVKKAWGLVGVAPQEEVKEGSTNNDIIYSRTYSAWSKALELIDDVIVQDQRGGGEGRRMVRLPYYTSIIGFLRDYDLFGIPTVVAKIYAAHVIHGWISPYFPVAWRMTKESWETVATIFMTRFYEPGKDIIMDLLNRKQNSMMDDFNLTNEEHSLDVMLKDLKLGEGTPENRQLAIERASRAYENALHSLFRNAASGNLVRLLLVQVQQLKVGMLNAVGDIDVLLQANKLNVRILATIPAILIVTLGSRFLARYLYNLRSRDLRPIANVHEEMTEHLRRMKSIILLGEGEGNRKRVEGVGSTSVIALGASEVGEFVLEMYCYLVLLDYTSPKPFPKRQCDNIHRSLREVLGSLKKRRSGGSGFKNDDRSLALVDIVMKMHEDMRRHL